MCSTCGTANPVSTLAYAGALVIHLFLAGVSWRRIILCVATLVVFANPLQFGAALVNLEDFGKRYLWPSAARLPDAASALRFPEVWSTISEVRSLHWTDTLRQILGRADLAAIGLVAFALFALRRWRSMAALGPVLLLGMLALAIVAALHLLPCAIRGHRLGSHRFA